MSDKDPHNGRTPEKCAVLKYKLSAMLSLVALTLSILAWGTLNPSVAWFSNNKEVTATGMAINVKTIGDKIIEITTHTVKEKNSSGQLVFDAAVSTDATIAIPSFDIIDDTEGHLLLKVTSPDSLPIKVSATTTSEGTITSFKNTPGVSYVIEMSIVTAIWDKNENTYNVTIPDSALKFASPTDTGLEIVDPDIELGGGDETKELFILISYNKENVQTLINSGAGTFSDDFTLILSTANGNIKQT